MNDTSVNDKENQKRILIETTIDLHAQIKCEAAIRNITIKKWITRLIVKELKRLEELDLKGTT